MSRKQHGHPQNGLRRDPLARVVLLGQKTRVRSTLGLLGACVLHGGVASGAAASLLELGSFVAFLDAAMRDRMLLVYDLEIAPPPPEPEPKPEEPEPEPERPKPVPTEPKPASDPSPPKAAEAAKILAADPDPDAPLDLTDQGFVTGSGERFAGGVTSTRGTSKTPVRDRTAEGPGNPAPRGPKQEPQVQEPDRSRRARPVSDNWNDCGFPREAQMEQIDYAQVEISVTVTPAGSAKQVVVLKDPGYGFGRTARDCALRRRYTPALDRSGRPITQTTAVIRVKFTRPD